MLPAGYTLRPARSEDAHAVADLINACEILDMGKPNTNAHALRRIWGSPDHAPEDSLLVVAPDGSYVAALNRFPEGEHLVEFDGYTLPAARGLGIGSALLDLVESEAHARAAKVTPPPTVRLNTNAWTTNEGAWRLLEARGYSLVRRWERMLIAMDAPPEPPALPAGVTIRAFVPGVDDQRFGEAMEEAQADEWGHIPLTWEQWRYYHIESITNLDPSLYFVAEADGEIIGGALCSWETSGVPEIGHVRYLAVRRPWRGRGVGLALVRSILATFYARGKRQVSLGVDADSPTHANALYRRAGMHVINETRVYEKTLTPSE
ncbi:MAG: GNAT family N-acetyltransferase [Chloroflexota bacterium]|nr:GNAT family N-acetyltransferase [Chloroflexota bacterium]